MLYVPLKAGHITVVKLLNVLMFPWPIFAKAAGFFTNVFFSPFYVKS